jgi:hypothetical protein
MTEFEGVLAKTEITKQIDVLRKLVRLVNFENNEGELGLGYNIDWNKDQVEIIQTKIIELVKKL